MGKQIYLTKEELEYLRTLFCMLLANPQNEDDDITIESIADKIV